MEGAAPSTLAIRPISANPVEDTPEGLRRTPLRLCPGRQPISTVLLL